MFLFGIYRSWGDKEESSCADIRNEARPRGRARAASVASQGLTSEDDEISTDEDFTDNPDVASRGFNPSVGPSPAFRPHQDGVMDMSPMFMPLAVDEEGEGQEDYELLPAATVDTKNSALGAFLQSGAYNRGKSY